METIKNKSTSWQSGFTFIELILYIAISSIFISATIIFAWDIIYGRVKSQVQVEVTQNIRFITDRISYELRNADGINYLEPDLISLANNDPDKNPTNIYLDSGNVLIGQGSTGACPVSTPCILNNNTVTATQLNFTDLSGTNSSTIKLELTIKHNNPENRQEWEREQSYQTSIQLRSN